MRTGFPVLFIFLTPIPEKPMKRFLKELFRLLNNDIWYLHLPRCALLFFFGILTLLRSVLSLRISAWLLIFFAGAAVLFICRKYTTPARHLAWLLPASAVGVLLFPRNYDMAGILLGAVICLLTALRAGRSPNHSSRIAAGTAFFAAAILLIKSFTAAWFDLYPAVALTFFASAAWESGNLKFSR